MARFRALLKTGLVHLEGHLYADADSEAEFRTKIMVRIENCDDDLSDVEFMPEVLDEVEIIKVESVKSS